MASFEAQDKRPSGSPSLPDHELLQEFNRLEAVGDLHFQAASFQTALDYYYRLLASSIGARIPLARVLVVVRKAVTACLHLGWISRADLLLERGRLLLKMVEDLDHAELAVAGLDEQTLDIEKARLQVRQAALHLQRGDYQAALTAAKNAFTFLALTDQHVEVANLQLTMGACYQRLGRLDKAEEFYQDSLSTYRRIGDGTGVATLYNALALLHKAACQWEKALSLLDRAVELASRNGVPPLMSWFYLNRGIVLTKMSRFAEAEKDLTKCLRLSQSLHDRIRETKALLALGKVSMLTNRLALAEEHILTAQRLATQERMQREAVIADEYIGDVMLARGDWDKAQLNYQIGLDKVRTNNDISGQASDLEGELLRRLAEAHRLAGDLTQAVAGAHAAVAVCEGCGEAYELGFCHLTLGRAYAADEDWGQADAHFRQGIDLFQSQNLQREWCDAVCSYLDVRFSSADKQVLLLLRRLLLDVQEKAAAFVSDRSLATCLTGLAQVQLRLGLCDDALLTVFELERVASGLEDKDDLHDVARLRRLVEVGLAQDMDGAAFPARVLTGIPGLVHKSDDSLNGHLGTFLRAICARVQAACGFLMLEQPSFKLDDLQREDTLPVAAARLALDPNLAGQLGRWYRQEVARTEQPLVFRRLERDAPLLRQVPALQGKVTGCVFLPIVLSQEPRGLLFLGLNEPGHDHPGLDPANLASLAHYMAFLVLFLAEKVQACGVIPEVVEVEGFANIITCDERMFEMLALLRKVATSDLTVLLHGETGTGKGLLAYALHCLSQRYSKRFLSINCAAVPETLIESELYGHFKGSFNGANRNKLGLLREAKAGTVFFDEIDKMPLSMQGKLLLFLDSRRVRPVGSHSEQAVDVRIVCASKTDLQHMVASGRFLEDLYFRLLDFPLAVPPLRQRPADIPLLVHHFVQLYGPELCGCVPDLSDGLLDALQQYDWPGNIYELRNTVRRAMVLAQGQERLRLEHFPYELAPDVSRDGQLDGFVPLRETLAAVEAREILQALKASRGNKTIAARLLQVSYPSLLKKISLYGLR